MNQKRFIVSPVKLTIALVTSSACIVLGIAVATINRYGSMIVFFLIAALFIWVAILNGGVVVLNDRGIELRVLFHKNKFLLWTDIHEIGCAGDKVFHKRNANDSGTIYLYFSEEIMTDDERHLMLVKWPPTNMIYMAYVHERLEAVQNRWSGKITFYNSGKVHF